MINFLRNLLRVAMVIGGIAITGVAFIYALAGISFSHSFDLFGPLLIIPYVWALWAWFELFNFIIGDDT